MEEYYRGVQRALQQPEMDFVELLLWGFGIFIAILFVFFIGKFIKTIITQRIQQIRYYGMDFEGLKRMLDTGLLSEEEYQQIRKKVAERLAEEMAQETGPAAPRLSVPVQKPAPTPKAGWPPETPLPRGGKPGDEKTTVPSLPAGRGPSKGKKALDLEGMFKAGLITAEEYEKLAQFFRDKKK